MTSDTTDPKEAWRLMLHDAPIGITWVVFDHGTMVPFFSHIDRESAIAKARAALKASRPEIGGPDGDVTVAPSKRVDGWVAWNPNGRDGGVIQTFVPGGDLNDWQVALLSRERRAKDTDIGHVVAVDHSDAAKR